MRPLGQQTNEVVLDNISAGVTFAGTWSDSTATVYFGNPGDVPHHLVGNGWVYLGEYYFNAGSNSVSGSVVISNLRGSTNGSVVITDAIRFGNGMGSVARGTNGVSGYPREEESCRYWIQANLGQGQSATIYDASDTDEHDSFSAPPLMSVEMTETNGTSFFKRIHISFHLNAGGQRGTEGLITSVPTPHQTALAQLCSQTLNDELVALGSPPLEFSGSIAARTSPSSAPTVKSATTVSRA